MGSAIPLQYEDDEDELPPAKPKGIPLATALPSGTKATQATPPTIPLANRESVVLAPSSGAGNLMGQTIQPGQGVDRIALATRAADTLEASSAPQFQRDLNAARQMTAGRGQLGSGMERGHYRDLVNERTLQLDTQRQSMMNKAVADSIADQYANIAIAQQQQGFQAGQQQTGFTQGLQREQMDLSKLTADRSFGLSERQQEFAEQMGLGAMGLDQARLALQQEVERGRLSIDEADQMLRAKGQEIQQQQFQDQLAQALGIATMADKTQNRGIDVQGKLAENELWLKIAQMLAAMGYSTKNPPPGNPGTIPPDAPLETPPSDPSNPDDPNDPTDGNTQGFY